MQDLDHTLAKSEILLNKSLLPCVFLQYIDLTSFGERGCRDVNNLQADRCGLRRDPFKTAGNYTSGTVKPSYQVGPNSAWEFDTTCLKHKAVKMSSWIWDLAATVCLVFSAFLNARTDWADQNSVYYTIALFKHTDITWSQGGQWLDNCLSRSIQPNAPETMREHNPYLGGAWLGICTHTESHSQVFYFFNGTISDSNTCYWGFKTQLFCPLPPCHSSLRQHTKGFLCVVMECVTWFIWSFRRDCPSNSDLTNVGFEMDSREKKFHRLYKYLINFFSFQINRRTWVLRTFTKKQVVIFHLNSRPVPLVDTYLMVVVTLFSVGKKSNFVISVFLHLCWLLIITSGMFFSP